jgi:hypothetical protein
LGRSLPLIAIIRFSKTGSHLGAGGSSPSAKLLP